eukprot:PhF_6_TR8524/c0_g1_i1/m.13355
MEALFARTPHFITQMREFTTKHKSSKSQLQQQPTTAPSPRQTPRTPLTPLRPTKSFTTPKKVNRSAPVTPNKSFCGLPSTPDVTPKRSATSNQNETPNRHHTEYHGYIVLEDAIGKVRIDKYPDGTLTVEDGYISDGDGVVVRSEPAQSSVTVKALLQTLHAEHPIIPGKPCGKCGLHVSILQGTPCGEMLYHQKCLVCSVCQRPPNAGADQFVAPTPGVFLHATAGSTCTTCVQCNRSVIGLPFTIQNNRMFHSSCLPNRCLICGGGVGGEHVVIAGNVMIHAACAVCSICRSHESHGEHLSSVTTKRGVIMFHTKCCSTCTSCKEAILPHEHPWELKDNQLFHPKCFACHGCGIVLGEDHRLIGGVPHCVMCYTENRRVYLRDAFQECEVI